MVGVGDIFVSVRSLSLMSIAAPSTLSDEARGNTRRQVQSSCCPSVVESIRKPRVNCARIDIQSGVIPSQYAGADNARKFAEQRQACCWENQHAGIEFGEIAQTNNQKTFFIHVRMAAGLISGLGKRLHNFRRCFRPGFPARHNFC